MSEDIHKTIHSSGKPTDADRHNAAYHGIPLAWIERYNELMGMSMNAWPTSLQQFAQTVFDKVGFCGDVCSCTVADWMKEQCKEAAPDLLEVAKTLTAADDIPYGSTRTAAMILACEKARDAIAKAEGRS